MMLSDSGINFPDCTDCMREQRRVGTGGGVRGCDAAVVVCAVVCHEEFAGVCEL